MNYQEIGGLAFAIVLTGISTIVWYRVFFIPGVLEKWREEVIQAHKGSKSRFKREDSFLFKPILIKVVVTFVMVGGYIAVVCAIADILKIW